MLEEKVTEDLGTQQQEEPATTSNAVRLAPYIISKLKPKAPPVVTPNTEPFTVTRNIEVFKVR